MVGDIIYIDDPQEAADLADIITDRLMNGLSDAEVSVGVGNGGLSAGGSIPWTWILVGVGGLILYNKFGK